MKYVIIAANAKIVTVMLHNRVQPTFFQNKELAVAHSKPKGCIIIGYVILGKNMLALLQIVSQKSIGKAFS